jgi:hypothetical protein
MLVHIGYLQSTSKHSAKSLQMLAEMTAWVTYENNKTANEY